ncbi:MAG TPA: CHRD domain-containing protein [Candidatus Dormibacteraeota bacterium]
MLWGRPFAVAAALLLAAAAGCGSPPSGGAATQRASAQLINVPDGTADVEYDPGARTLTLAVHVTGVMAGEELAARIRRGGCGGPAGDVLDTLGPTAADAHGVVDAIARVPGVEAVPTTAALEFIPLEAATGAASAPLFCGDLSGQTGMVRLVPGATPQAGPAGTAALAVDIAAHTLNVRLVVQGLVPGSWHPANIHDGSCAAQGPMVLTLPSVQADARGRAVLHATLSGVDRLGRWYVNIHRGPDMTGDGAAPLSCGDVTRG